MKAQFFRFHLLLLAATVSLTHAEDAAFFENKIRPILAEHCYECHSADKKQKGNLLLDTKEGTLKGGDTGPSIVPGDPARSLLITAVKWQDSDLEMPPKKKLSDAQIADLEAWVKMGAPDPRTGGPALSKIEQHLRDAKKHWAFQAVPALQSQSLDELTGFKAAPRAEKRTLIRRAYLDLIGVPPSYEEVTAFEQDCSPHAFDQLVDKLLADPRYGERWGRHWLDVARYADNMGSIFTGDDTYANAFTYRDYVIQSLNADKPYDRFILEQLAADHLETAKETQTLAAMGFLGLGRRKDRKIDDDMLDDTIDVIGRGLLGLTIGCARCHDHKLEPITTKDYYGLYSILKSSKEPDNPPILPQIETEEVRDFRTKNNQLRREYATVSIQSLSKALHEARSHLGDYMILAKEHDWKNQYEDKMVGEVCIKRKLNASVYAYFVKSRKDWVEAHPEVFAPFLEFTRGQKLEPAPALHPLVARAFETPVSDLQDLGARYNQIFSAVDSAWRTLAQAEIDKPVTLTAEETNLSMAERYAFMDTLQPLAFDRLEALEQKIVLPDMQQESLRQLLLVPNSGMKFPNNKVRSARIIPPDDASEKAFVQIEKLGQTHPGAPVRAMTFVDAAKMYEGKVFVRGNPSMPGAPAPRQFLSVLRHISPEPFPKDKSGRLQLAQAIVSPQNPLTARVIVNRIWGWHFGENLVSTPSDFGFRGEAPSNQPLLDHLAGWFMHNGWSFKKLHRHIMLSASYQRASFPMRPLDLEPFRDSLLAVTGRLKADAFGKPSKIDATTRRTVYGFVDRRTLPSLYRSFDFPDPSFTAAKRNRTALTPRALILLNSPLLTDSAKTLASTLQTGRADDSSRVQELYRRVLQRLPTAGEMQRALTYLAAYPENDLVHPESQDWQYGYGEFDVASKQVKAFASLSAFDGRAFKANAKAADGKSGGVMLNAMGGDPGPGQALATIRRWVAPLDGDINITAELTHMDAKTEGVTARIISSGSGVLGEWKAKGQSVCTDLTKIHVKRGEVLDFIVSSQTDKDGGAYQWSPSIIVPGTSMPGMSGVPQRWDARVDFADPKKPAKPLSALEELCQALLLSPEFAVLE